MIFPSSKIAVIVVLGSVFFTPVSVASDVSFHVVPLSCRAGDVVDVVAFGEGVTLLVHPAAAAVESNNMLISKTREIFLIISNSPQQGARSGFRHVRHCAMSIFTLLSGIEKLI